MPDTDTAARLDALEEENRRLRRVNEVLMEQAENALQGGESAYGLFQTAAILEDTVRARTEELSEANHRLHFEINRRREVELALVEAKIGAEQANENKTKFLTAVSHDLQQPLTAARLLLQALAERLDARPLLDLVDTTNQTLQTMENLLRSLVDISRLEAGITETRIRDFALGTLVDQLAAEYGLTAQSRSLEFRHVSPRAMVRTDPVLLERALRNLLTNAVRYTPRGRILLGVRRRGTTLRLEVWDTGVGIPADKLQEVFHEFHQLPQRARQHEKGLGLGLTIVDRICGLLDLPVTVRSTPGRGSVFAISVPLAPAGGRGIAGPARMNQAPSTILAGRDVAVIENDNSVLSALVTLLETWDMTVTAERSSHRLLVRLRRNGITPDVVISDYQLDGENGEQALARLEAFFGRTLPSMVITGAASEELAARLHAQGRRLLSKPINPARLRALLQRLLVQARG